MNPESQKIIDDLSGYLFCNEQERNLVQKAFELVVIIAVTEANKQTLEKLQQFKR